MTSSIIHRPVAVVERGSVVLTLAGGAERGEGRGPGAEFDRATDPCKQFVIITVTVAMYLWIRGWRTVGQTVRHLHGRFVFFSPTKANMSRKTLEMACLSDCVVVYDSPVAPGVVVYEPVVLRNK